MTFTTVTDVERMTGYEVTEEDVLRAQVIIESFVGRIEAEVTNAVDQMLLARATAFQVAYMKNDPLRVYEQMATAQIGQFGANVTFRSGDTISPFIAPMAAIACQRLSWKRIRSVKTGSIYGPVPRRARWDEG